jgi:hypothetical protein
MRVSQSRRQTSEHARKDPRLVEVEDSGFRLIPHSRISKELGLSFRPSGRLTGETGRAAVVETVPNLTISFTAPFEIQLQTPI